MALKEIPLDKLDELFAVCTDLNVLTYIKTQIQDDRAISITEKNEQKEGKQNVDFFILNLEISAVSKLSSLIKEISGQAYKI